MRKFLLLCLLIIPLLLSPVFAETTGQLGGQVDGSYPWILDDDGTLIGNSDAELSLGGVEKTSWGSVMHFVPTQFSAFPYDQGDGASNKFTEITTSTAPSLEMQNSVACLVWDDSDDSYAQVTFKVPTEYVSGGSFKAFVDYDSGSDNPEIEYFVYINSDGVAWDTAYTTQTPVDPAGTAGTPELVALPVTTDFASLAAGDVVTFAINRNPIDSSSAQLELYYVDFYYNE